MVIKTECKLIDEVDAQPRFISGVCKILVAMSVTEKANKGSYAEVFVYGVAYTGLCSNS